METPMETTEELDVEVLAVNEIDKSGRVVLPSQLKNDPTWSVGTSVYIYKINTHTLVLRHLAPPTKSVMGQIIKYIRSRR